MERTGLLAGAGLVIVVVAPVVLRTPDQPLKTMGALPQLALAERPADARTAARAGAVLLGRIHFNFDEANVRPDDRLVLDRKIAILRANATVRIRIAGDCDERGSERYIVGLASARPRPPQRTCAFTALTRAASRRSPTDNSSRSIAGTTRRPGRRTEETSSSF
jgi:peptidoglycan-associated lipoprotein